MEINFTLNHKPVVVDAPTDITLLALLRDHFKLNRHKRSL